MKNGKSRKQHDLDILEERNREKERQEQKKIEDLENTPVMIQSKRKTIRSSSIREVKSSIASQEKQQKEEEHMAYLAVLAAL